MRRILIASLLAGLAGKTLSHTTGHEGYNKRRKSLGFGPELPHAIFHSSPYQIPFHGFAPGGPKADPFEVANLFAKGILADQLSDSVSYRIRKDSYTDPHTRVTHVYLRQVVNGFEVADGDMNLNIKNGAVISYGSSFYKGPIPSPFENSDNEFSSHPHKEYCQILLNEVKSRNERGPEFQVQGSDGEQFILESQSPITDAHLDELNYIVHSNCRFHELPYQLPVGFNAEHDIVDFRPALLQFMIAATPNDEVVHDIMQNYDAHLNGMVETPTHDFAPSGSSIEFLVDNVPDAINPVKARMAYIQVPNRDSQGTHLVLVWKFEVEMRDNWYEAAVSAIAPHRIISVVDWASDAPAPAESSATYNVFPWGINDPSEGQRSVNFENFDSLASPMGWHSIPHSCDPLFKGKSIDPKLDFWRNTTTTWGNNVFAQENWEGENAFINNHRPDAGHSKVFDYKYNPKFANKTGALAEAKAYIDATVTQLFYTTNLVHDLYYRYGFHEEAGNFQQYNFGRGGKENDAVIANAQDGSGFNNANFMTPPDGQNGRMRMYLWNTANPYRDGDLEAGIVIHELSHGLSTRLTGGPANSGCLGWGESGGMGEGWGDFLATTIRSHQKYSDYAMGAWASNKEDGIRNYIYSLNETINPATYKTLDKPGFWGVHAIGEVWAEMLWVVLQGLIEKHGYSDSLFPPKPSADGTVPEEDFFRPSTGNKRRIPKYGNTLMVQLVIDAMKLQTCRPSFFNARDAIIQADQELTDGENFCTLWKGFAARGLGPNAKVEGRTPWGGGIRANGYEVPPACRS